MVIDYLLILVPHEIGLRGVEVSSGLVHGVENGLKVLSASGEYAANYYAQQKGCDS
jgi:hypothetical protein